MPKNWDIHIIPASHLDYGWAASPGECLSYVSEIIKMAVDDIQGDYPDYKFTIEYTLFLKHFLEVYPDYLEAVKQLLKEGKIEVCTTMVGAIEQFLDGEMLIHELVSAKRWIRETLNYEPVTVQHTDLPGHVIQIAQFLRGAGIQNMAYSRYHPPVPLHQWRSPDGSEVVACCHFHGDHAKPGVPWEGYGWGWVLFVHNADMDKVFQELPKSLQERESVWPRGVNDLLMGCQSDLQPGEPEMLQRIAAWNQRFPQWGIRISTISQFFAAVDPQKLPTYCGEAPYGFFALPSIWISAAQEMRRADHAITTAEKWSVFRQLTSLGSVQRGRLEQARNSLFLPHDHNTGGRRGEINDSERYKDALNARLEGESLLQEAAMTFTVHIDYRPCEDGTYPITVFNSLSWNRRDVVETYIEVPKIGIQGLRVIDSTGRTVPSQILRLDERKDLGWSRIYLLFVAEDVPAHGYETFYVAPMEESPEEVNTSLICTTRQMKNRFFRIDFDAKGIRQILWQKTPLVGKSTRRFNRLFALEDRMDNTEGPPWDMDKVYSGKRWQSQIRRVEIVESGPVRAVLRFYGRIWNSPFTQDLVVYDSLERIDLLHTIHYRTKMHTQVRAAYPLNVPQGEATYESTYGVVRLGKDEMPGTFRGHGERWVQKWIDISNSDFGVTLATRQIPHAISDKAIEPILIRTATDCGTPFYYYDQDQIYTFHYSLIPHRGHWRRAATHRAGWEWNNPLYACNMTTCFPIQPIHKSRKLPEKCSFLTVSHKNVVITAVKPAQEAGTFIVRLVEYHGRSGQVTLTCKEKIQYAEEVNFLEERLCNLSVIETAVKVGIRKYGIHSVKIRLDE